MDIWRDFRYGLRRLGMAPGFTVVVVLVLALGIGANTAVFSLVDSLLVRQLPVPRPEQIVSLEWAAPVWPAGVTQTGSNYSDASGRTISTSFSYRSFDELQRENSTLASMFGFTSLGNVSLEFHGRAWVAAGEAVTAEYFVSLGVRSKLGRLIVPADVSQASLPVAVISYAYWASRLGRDSLVLGKTIFLNGMPYTIIGVAQRGFFGLDPSQPADLWIPLVAGRRLGPYGIESSPQGRSPFAARHWWWVEIAGRLKSDATRAQAQIQLDDLFHRQLTGILPRSISSSEYPHIHVVDASGGLNTLRRQFSHPLLLLMAVVGLVLLVACANLATLLLARASGRRQESAVRLLIGATRSRLVRQLFTETITVALLGAAMGLFFAWLAIPILVALAASGQPLAFSVVLDGKVLGFTMGIAIISGILFGLIPALRVSEADFATALRGTPARFSGDWRRVYSPGSLLVVIQVAISLLLLVGVGLFGRTLFNYQNERLGFDPSHVLVFSVAPSQVGYQGTALNNFYSLLRDHLIHTPGVESVGSSAFALISGSMNDWGITVEGGGSQRSRTNQVYWNLVGPGFFRVMHIPIILGRGVTSRDTSDSPPVAVINATTARLLFGHQSPIGRRFRFSGLGDRDYRIVGVCGNAKFYDLSPGFPPTVYVPYNQDPNGGTTGEMTFEVRTAGNPGKFISTAREILHNIDTRISLRDISSQQDLIDQTLAQQILLVRVVGFFGLLTLLLTATGLYGVISYTVKRRTHEIGIRMALGASRIEVLRMVISRCLFLVGVGTILGVAIGLGVTRWISNQLYGVRADDPITIATAIGVLVAVSSVAGYLPARRAAQVEPSTALRYE